MTKLNPAENDVSEIKATENFYNYGIVVSARLWEYFFNFLLRWFYFDSAQN